MGNNAGRIATNEPFVTESYTAEGAVAFGVPLQLGTNPQTQVKKFVGSGDLQVQTITIDAALITGNIMAGKVNGRSIDAVTYASSNDATMAAIAAEILQHEAVLTVVASDVGSVGFDNTLTVTTAGVGLRADLSDFAVSAGATQAGVTLAETTEEVAAQGFFGVACESESAGDYTSLNGVASAYLDKQLVRVLRRGSIWVPVVEAIGAGEQAAIVITAGTSGFAAGDWVGENAAMGTGVKQDVIGGVFKRAASANADALLQINNPQ